MFAESVANEYPHLSTRPIPEKKFNPKFEKKIPKGCKVWKIGKYEVVARNRKNAIRKALNLRKNQKN